MRLTHIFIWVFLLVFIATANAQTPTIKIGRTVSKVGILYDYHILINRGYTVWIVKKK